MAASGWCSVLPLALSLLFAAIKDQQRFLHCLREATAALPIGCYAIVRRIMAMLSVVSKFSELSKMNPKNIAMIFTPTMLRVRGETVGEVRNSPALHASGSFASRSYLGAHRALAS